MSISSFPQKSTQSEAPERTQAAQVFALSARQAFGPINAALKGLNSIKVHELPDAERHKLEHLCNELEVFGERLIKIYTEAAVRSDWADYIARHVLRLKDEFNIKTN